MLMQPWAMSERGRLELEGVLARSLRRAAAVAGEDDVAVMPLPEPQPVNPTVMRGNVAVINVTGVLTRTPGWQRAFGMPDHATLTELTDAVTAAAADDSVAATLLNIDSPGGTVPGTSELAEAIYAHRAVKPVWAHAANCMCSAAFWTGTQADRVYVGPVCDAVNLGVYGTLYDVSEMLKGMGVTAYIARSGKFKGIGAWGEPLTAEAKAEFTRLVEIKRDLFVDAVARGRGVPRDKVEAVADGRVLVGQQVVDAGMADDVMSFEATLALLSAGVGPGGRSAGPGGVAA